jgi:hypothetical protein
MIKTKLDVVQRNLKASELLVNNGYALQSFFLILPIFELVGKFLKQNIDPSKSELFTYGLIEIFNLTFNEISINQGCSIYEKIRNGLSHKLSLEDDPSKLFPNNIFRNIPNIDRNKFKYIRVKITSENSILDENEISFGIREANKKLEEFFKRDEIKNDIFFLTPSFEYDENIPSASGTTVVNSIQIPPL